MIAYIVVEEEGDEKEDKGEEDGEDKDEEEGEGSDDEKKKPYKIKVLFRENLYDLDIPNINEDSNLVPIKNNEKTPLLMVQQYEAT